jgi:Reverse transcriptase (RNA-dependent DNA polymerase)
MIRKWYKNAKEDKSQCQQSLEIWNKIVIIVQMTFREGDIPTSFTYGVLVLIPKPDQSFRGIALLETIYKLISMIIHLQLLTTIKLHNAVHGFRTQRGTGTATINVKLLLQKAKRQSNQLYMIFIDVKKAYDSVK